MSDNNEPAVDPRNVQNEPAMDMHTSTDEERIDGIVDQTRADVGDKSLERIQGVLRQRFEQSGTAFTEELLVELAQRVKI
ncbi:hypothetical protein FHX48_000341 [Microbacterium halimionae]|uniref:Uncharacterized protein n=1 Tax=Microbacterium halimionae TaxID=1526413 RepID=A0A7W3JLX8_9MICO|nr:hypothetical protein [Microbacterium halimionae]MBA8815289.1 hypothetical protein [Microbacterium halimionae]NII93920.1 hypothetical protein [Microbacterium halimionae]